MSSVITPVGGQVPPPAVGPAPTALEGLKSDLVFLEQAVVSIIQTVLVGGVQNAESLALAWLEAKLKIPGFVAATPVVPPAVIAKG